VDKVLAAMRRCGVLPCLCGGKREAVPYTVEALREVGFPCAEIDLDWQNGMDDLSKLFLEECGVWLGARAHSVQQAQLAFSAGARWVSLEQGASREPAWRKALFTDRNSADAAEGSACRKAWVYLRGAGAEPAWTATAADGLIVSECPDANRRRFWLAEKNAIAVAEPAIAYPMGQAREQARALLAVWQETLGFSLAHIGLNGENPEQAEQTAQSFSKLLGLPYRSGEASAFAGTLVEVMKTPGRGAYGHIGILTDDLDRGMYFAERAGFAFDPESRKNNAAGQAILYYLDRDISGFAVHLLQK